MDLVRLVRKTDGPVWKWLREAPPADTPELLRELADADRGFVLATAAGVEQVTDFLAAVGFRYDGNGDWQMPVGTQPLS